MGKSKQTSSEWDGTSDGIQISGPADEDFTYSFADLGTSDLTMSGNLTMSGPETSYTIDGMIDSDEVELREKYPALQQAHEHYLSVLEICKTKEKEEDED
jgi:hypothetical protein